MNHHDVIIMDFVCVNTIHITLYILLYHMTMMRITTGWCVCLTDMLLFTGLGLYVGTKDLTAHIISVGCNTCRLNHFRGTPCNEFLRPRETRVDSFSLILSSRRCSNQSRSKRKRTRVCKTETAVSDPSCNDETSTTYNDW